MNHLHKLSIRSRLFLSFGCMLFILLAFSIMVTSHLNLVVRQYNEFIDSVVTRQRYVSYIETTMTNIRFCNSIRGYIIKHPQLYDIVSQVSSTMCEIYDMQQHLNNYRNNVASCQILSDEDKDLRIAIANEIERILKYYYFPAMDALDTAIENNDIDGLVDAHSIGIPTGNILSYLIKELYDETIDFALYMSNQVTNQANFIVSMMWVVTVCIIPFGILITLLMIRTIQVPIINLKSSLREIRNGNLNHPIRTDHNDELGMLSNDIADMVNSISVMNKAASVADYLDTMICVTDSDQKLVYINKSFADNFGIDQNNYEGKSCIEPSSKRTEMCYFCNIRDNSGETFTDNNNLDFVYDSSTSRWYTCRIVEVQWPDGRMVNLHYRNDSTELKNHIDRQEAYEEQLEAIAKVAEAASAAKSVFIANTNHEIRTPLNSILGYSELALDDPNPNPDTTKEYLQNIVGNAKKLLSIVNDILDVSKMESDDVNIESIPFDVNEVLNYCRTRVESYAVSKDIELFFYAEPVVNKRLIGDPTKLVQICSNILSNAVKFTEYGIVKFSTEVTNISEDNCTILFEIRDSGIGMTDEQIAQIFELFSQGDGGSTRRHGGAGLGLTIAKRLVEAMGGELIVESALGIGSKFSFILTFPTVEVDSNVLMPSLNNIPKPFFCNGEVLVVEDNEMNQGVICEHLKRVGLTSVVVNNGLEAVEIVRQRVQDAEKPFDLIFMDIHMPIMDGLEASSIISKWNTGTPIAAMTANVMTIAEESYEKCGMMDCISKPYTVQDLWLLLLKYFTPVNSEYSTTPVQDNLNGQNIQSNGENLQSTQSGVDDTEYDDDCFLQTMMIHFVKNNQNTYTDLKTAIESGDMVLAHRIAHNLKSNAGHIKKSKLQFISGELEQALKKDQKYTDHVSALKLELNLVLNNLAHLLKDKEITDTTLSKEEFLEIAYELEPLLNSGNAAYLTYVDRLKAVSKCSRLVEFIENFDSPAAVTELIKLKEQWSE